MSHSAVLLAGGKSSRMGRDKASLLVDGIPLWRRQLDCLRALEPAELFISGPEDGPYAGSGVPVVPDIYPGHGPLGGIASAIRHCRTPWLVVLAIDMPRMTAAYLRAMVEMAHRTAHGVVPRFADGRWQPLAGVYSRDAGFPAMLMLAEGERKMENFARELLERGDVVALEVAPVDEPFFENWNTPADLPHA